jgi:Ca-activated chloride channel family protein
MNRTAPAPFGLEAWLKSTRIMLPLRGMEIRADVFTGFARVEIDQVFVQSNKQPLDCRYVFPLPADAAVHRCEMHVNGRVVLARVEENAEAERLYKKAKSEGRRAALARGERENLFTLELGNLQPADVILMRFSYVQPLQRLQEQRTLRVPMTPGVRFIPGNPLLRPNSGSGASDDTDEVPDASRISPPRIDGSHPDAAALQISVRLCGGVETARAVSSPSHIIAIRPKENDLRVSLATDREFPEKDFVMTWIEPAPDAPVARFWLDESRRGVLELRLPNKQAVTSAPVCDVYFLLDRSGSMRGENWLGACRAVAGLKSRLAPETPVWLTLFESSHRDWAEKPLQAQCVDFGRDGEALVRTGVGGGTNMLEALSHVVGNVKKHSKGRSAAILLLTDGDIGNEEEVVACAREAGCPVHVIGISISPNDALRAVAEETGGRAVFLSPGEDIPAATERFVPLLRPPLVTGIKLPKGWRTADGSKLRDLTTGDDFLVPVSAEEGATAVSLSGKSADGKRWGIRFSTEPCKPAALVWARARIRHLERRKDPEALALAKEYNLLCKTAAFVAWDEAEKVVIAKREIIQPSMSVKACTPLSPPVKRMSPPHVSRLMESSFLDELNDATVRLHILIKELNEAAERFFHGEAAGLELKDMSVWNLKRLKKLADGPPKDISDAGVLLRQLIELFEHIKNTHERLASGIKHLLQLAKKCQKVRTEIEAIMGNPDPLELRNKVQEVRAELEAMKNSFPLELRNK